MGADEPRLIQPPPGWEIPRRTIYLATQARSGSSYVADCVSGTGALGVPLEYFNPKTLRRHFPGRPTSVLEGCLLAGSAGRSANDVVGIKLFPWQFRRARQRVRLSQWFGDGRWVFLRRRDLLGQAVSLAIAMQTLAFLSGDQPAKPPIYSADRIGRHLQALTFGNAQWEAYFARNEVARLELCYEDVMADPSGAVRAIAAHAGIDEPLDQVKGPTLGVEVQRTPLNDEWRTRFVADRGDPDELAPARGKNWGWRQTIQKAKDLFGPDRP